MISFYHDADGASFKDAVAQFFDVDDAAVLALAHSIAERLE